MQGSATVLMFSNYREAFVMIAVIDLKTSRMNKLKTFKLSNKPTVLYQIDENNILVGTEGGKIEHWIIDQSVCKKIYDAHPESQEGISAILEMQTDSELLRGEVYDPSAPKTFKLIATASKGTKEFRLWKLDLAKTTIEPYLKIETTITGGIKYLIESSPTQIVAANENVIKFYDFVDKSEKSRIDAENKRLAELNGTVKEIF